MKERALNRLTLSARALAAIGAMALIATRECQPPYVAVFLSFFILGFWMNRFPNVTRVASKVQPFFAALIFIVAVLDFLYLSNSFLLSVAHFLLCVQGTRMLVLVTSRENLGSVLLSSMMVLSASTLAVEWTFFVMLVLFLPMVIWTLMLHNVCAEMESSPSAPVPWPVLAPPLRASAWMALAVAVACCAVVFLIFPRFNFAGFKGQFLQPVRKTGFTNQVDLNRSGKIFLDDSIAMRVEIGDDDRKKWTGYIRGTALSYFDGKVWRRTPGQFTRVYPSNRTDFQVVRFRRSPGRPIRQTIYLESMDSPLLFGVPRAAIFRLDRPFLDIDQEGGVQRAIGDTWRMRYEVDSYAETPLGTKGISNNPPLMEARVIKDAGMPAVMETYLAVDQLGSEALGEQLGEMARRAARGSTTPFIIAQRISEFLQNGFMYSLDNGTPKENQAPLEYFLFDRKAGHCEHFASAMCILLRKMNIPSRMATGFVAHEWNKRGRYYIVRMKDAHAWVEAYVEPHGWVAFDPSPRDFVRPPANVWSDRVSEMADYLNLRWNRYILSYDLQQQVSIVRGITRRSQDVSNRFESFTGKLGGFFRWKRTEKKIVEDKTPSRGAAVFSRAVPYLALAAVAGLIGVFLRRGRPKKGVWFYRDLLKTLGKKNRSKQEGETLAEYVASLDQRMKSASSDIRVVVDAYYKVRFADEGRLEPDEEKRVKAALSHLRQV